MADSVAVFQPGSRFIDSANNILAGGRIEFYAANTTDPKTVHSDADLTEALGPIVHLDSGGAPVAEEGSSTKISVYVGTDPYKVVIKNSAGVIIETKDDLQGAFDSSSILANVTIIAQTEVVTITEDRLIVSADRGKLFNVNTTGGSVAVTLPDATTISNGVRYGFRMAGTANALNVRSTGGQTIGKPGAPSTAFALTKLGESIWVVNDGGNWLIDTYVPPLLGTIGVIEIVDRLSVPPDSPDAGARYIVTSGPSGAWSSYLQHDVVEADGNGGWFRITPLTDCGWIAYVKDENIYYYFRGSGWVAETATASQQGTVKAADRAVSESGTATDAATMVGTLKYHPHVAVAGGCVTVSGGTPTLRRSFNVASITDNGPGDLGVVFDDDMADANYMVVATVEATEVMFTRIGPTKSASGFRVLAKIDDGSHADPASYSFVVYGELAP